MKLLNLGCGSTRIQGAEWTNCDDLHSQHAQGSPERIAIDSVLNYVNCNFLQALPFESDSFDGILASHVIEHFNAQDGLKLMKECRRILKPGGCLLVSVPDASYFRKVLPEDNRKNQMRLFDEMLDDGNPYTTYFEAALWFNEHLAILTEDALWCYFQQAGFYKGGVSSRVFPYLDGKSDEILHSMANHLNRRKFSLEMFGMKFND